LALFALSNGTYWSQALAGAAAVIGGRPVPRLQSATFSMRAALKDLEPLAVRCRGLLTLEHDFLGAFAALPIDRVHDIWGIPPFGRHGDGIDDGLRPERIDCLFISRELTTGIGLMTNYQLRYENHIQPYARSVLAAGGEAVEVPGYGQVVLAKGLSRRAAPTGSSSLRAR
jgi:hypothetical protein